MTPTTNPVPFVCDMTGAPDTPQERIAEYQRLFAHALVGRERTATAVIWRFTASPGIEAWVRDLAAREAACCPFLSYGVSVHGGQVVYAISGDDPAVQPVLDLVHRLPDDIAEGLPTLLRRLDRVGLEIRRRPQALA